MNMDLALYGALTAASGFGLFKLVRGVPFPEKWPWALSAGLVTLYVALAAAYALGALLREWPLSSVFFPLKAAVQTTGALALAVATYSRINGADKISAQWFALPMGSAPLAMLYQYVPPYVIGAVFVGAAVAYAAKHKSPFAVPCAATHAAAGAEYVGAAVPGLMTTDQLVFALYSASVVAAGVLATGGKIKGM